MEQNKIILYQDDNEITRVAVRFADEDLWLTQNQLAEIYCTSRENITMHIKNIYADEELLLDSTSKDFLLVREEGSRQVKRNVAHYNLDMIIALGYRVQSQVAMRFRRWATQRLHEYIQKGFARPSTWTDQFERRFYDADYSKIAPNLSKDKFVVLPVDNKSKTFKGGNEERWSMCIL